MVRNIWRDYQTAKWIQEQTKILLKISINKNCPGQATKQVSKNCLANKIDYVEMRQIGKSKISVDGTKFKFSLVI